jgi:hypothetical protein
MRDVRASSLKHREDEITELTERLEEARAQDFDRGEEP